MQRRRRIAGRHNNETQEQAYHRQALHTGHAVRFYWSGNYRVRTNSTGQKQVVRRLSIGSTAWRTTPTIIEAEWTLATLISAWMHWVYADEKENDGLF